MKSGKIILYNVNGVTLSEKKYATLKERKQIMDEWREYYGSLLNNLHYHITPDVSDNGVSIEELQLMAKGKAVRLKLAAEPKKHKAA